MFHNPACEDSLFLLAAINKHTLFLAVLLVGSVALNVLLARRVELLT